MSDIGPIPALEKLMILALVLIVLAPPVIVGTICMLLHVLVPGQAGKWTALYFVTGIAASIGLLWWAADWLSLPELWEFSPMIASASSGGVFGLFLGGRRLVRRTKGRTRRG